MRNFVIVFALGLVCGAGGAWFAARYAGPRLPAALGGPVAVEAQVAAERLDAGRLLLTLETPEQAVLATFGERVAELDLLIDVGDVVTVRLPRDEPFVDDPPVIKVRKGEAAGAAAPADRGASPAEPPAGLAGDDDAGGAPTESAPETETFEDGTFGHLEPGTETAGDDEAGEGG